MNYKEELIVFDYETPKKCFLACFLDLSSMEFHDFIISKDTNDLFRLIKYLKDNQNKYFVGYNSLKFDSQVTEYIYRNMNMLSTLSGEDVALKISNFAIEEIEKTTYGMFNTYRESDLTFKTIDLPCIWHFFNDKKRVSLKQLEYEMRAETIENLEFDMDQEFDEIELAKLIKYCHNDISYTYLHFLYTIGETDHKLYKGKDKIKDREIIMEEVGLPCLNWDDVKIGAEWNKKDYLEATKKDEKDLKPKKINTFYGKRFRQFFPDTVEFKTDRLKAFVKDFGNSFLKSTKEEYIYIFSPTLKVALGKGGIHSQEKYRRIDTEGNDVYYIQADIGSQYPNGIRKYGVFPKHLGKEWFEMIVSKISRRINFKQLFKKTKEPKYNSLQEMGKMALNGGSYGRLNTPGDWQEDPCCMLQVTVGCQLEILMIGEALVEAGFDVVSFNTDGFDTLVPKNRLKEYLKICSYYEKKIGNDELGNLEYTVFDWIVQTSVNDYLAKKTGEFMSDGTFKSHVSVEEDDEYKCKGDFEYWKELNKNSSFSILPHAYFQYYVHNISIEDTINSHTNIFDFCARSNSGKTYDHLDTSNSTIINSIHLPKLIRYYVSKNGIHIKKMVKAHVTTNANDMNVTPAEYTKTICNTLYKESHAEHLANVNRQWYIDRCNETVIGIEKKRNVKGKRVIDKNQISLF